MKKFSIIFSFLAVLLMAVMAGAFIFYIAVALYKIDPVPALCVGLVVFAAVLASAYIPDIWPQGALFMAISAKAIYRNAAPNNIAGLGGSHYYAFVEDIDTYPAALTPDFINSAVFGDLVTIPVDDPFIMVAGKYFHPIPCTEETGEVKSQLVGPTDCMAFENTASFSNAGNNADLSGFLAYTANKPVIMIMKELNGNFKVVGTQDYAARMVSGERTGGIKVADGNMFKHSYKSCSTIPCPTYLAPVPVDPTEPQAGVV